MVVKGQVVVVNASLLASPNQQNKPSVLASSAAPVRVSWDYYDLCWCWPWPAPSTEERRERARGQKASAQQQEEEA